MPVLTKRDLTWMFCCPAVVSVLEAGFSIVQEVTSILSIPSWKKLFSSRRLGKKREGKGLKCLKKFPTIGGAKQN